jgi:hyperosmotically inducible periplasmic protein
MRISKFILVAGAVAAFVGPSIAAIRQQVPAARATPQKDVTIKREVRHELVMLPWYSVFDNLAYRVSGGRVTLEGQVVRPSLRSDAEAAVRKIEGVESVDNQIEILPTSINDDQTRQAEFRAIYSQSSLQRYAEGAVPPIHIIVKDGHVTLEGVVATEADKSIANIQANAVPGVFSVTNNLVVEGGK